MNSTTGKTTDHVPIDIFPAVKASQKMPKVTLKCDSSNDNNMPAATI